MLKIGVLGAGHLGRIHLKLLKEIKDFQLIGFFDPDDVNANKAHDELGVKRFGDMETLLNESEVVDIVTPRFRISFEASHSSRFPPDQF